MIVTDTQTLEDAIIQWIDRFHREAWSGSLTLHFNQGRIQSYEPKPTIRLQQVK